MKLEAAGHFSRSHDDFIRCSQLFRVVIPVHCSVGFVELEGCVDIFPDRMRFPKNVTARSNGPYEWLLFVANHCQRKCGGVTTTQDCSNQPPNPAGGTPSVELQRPCYSLEPLTRKRSSADSSHGKMAIGGTSSLLSARQGGSLDLWILGLSDNFSSDAS